MVRGEGRDRNAGKEMDTTAEACPLLPTTSSSEAGFRHPEPLGVRKCHEPRLQLGVDVQTLPHRFYA